MIRGPDIIAARELLGWSVPTLARRAGLSQEAVQKAEDETLSLPDLGILDRIGTVLEAAGIEFLPEEGGTWSMRLQQPRA